MSTIICGSSAMATLLDEVRQESFRLVRPKQARRNKFFAAVARILGRTVSIAAVRSRRTCCKAAYWPCSDCEAAYAEAVDGRPVTEMMVAGATVKDAAEVCRIAREKGLWNRGYGSPYSRPALHLLTLAEWGCGELETYLAATDIPGGIGGEAANYISRRDGRLHPDWATRLREWDAVRGASIYPQEKRVAALRTIRRLRRSGVKPEHARLIGLAYAGGDTGAGRTPLWRLRQRWGSPRANWWALGLKAPKGVATSPAGLGAKQLKTLLETESPQNLAAEPVLWDSAVAAVQVWGPLAETVARAAGLHDAGQLGFAVPAEMPDAWVKYRERHQRWIARNINQALRLPSGVMTTPGGENRPPEELAALAQYEPVNPEGQKLLLAAKQVNRSSVPAVNTARGSLCIESLERDSMLALQLGNLTHCCMHIGGAADSCLRHGMTNPEGGFWVVRNTQGRVIAQSWVWRHTTTLVVDNIEALRSAQSEHNRLLGVYKAAASQVLGRLGIERVVIGVGFSDIELPLPKAECPPTPEGVYTDTRQGVRLLAEAAK